MSDSKRAKRKRASSSLSGTGNGSREGRAPRPLIGIAALMVSLMILGSLAGVSFSSAPRVYLVGEIAGRDVTADRDLLVEDTASTQAKRKQVADGQPLVMDLDQRAASRLEEAVIDLFEDINQASTGNLDAARWAVAEQLNAEISKSVFALWRREDFQNLVLGRVLPWLVRALESGVVGQASDLGGRPTGIMVRDLAGGVETLRLDLADIPDREALLKDLNTTLKTDMRKPLFIRRGILSLVGPLVSPSLALNTELTRQRRNRAAEAVEPVFYHIKEGEIIVRKGEPVRPAQQRKIQALVSRHGDETFSLPRAAGIFLVSAMLFVGLYLPARAGRLKALKNRDLVLTAVVMVVFGVLSKALVLVDLPLARQLGLSARDIFPYNLPLAGAAGMLAMFFPYVVCLIPVIVLSFVCAFMAGGGLGLTAYYLLGGMLFTALVRQAQTRSELLKTVFPLVGGLVLAWAGINLLDFQGATRAWAGGLYVMANGFLSLLVVLGLSPMAEYLFGYTSRFKLMEMMNLEQPLLQRLMVAAPGTYHHSLILSNMVEAGARAIGGNALLAKVAALYHDIGKLKNPQYFIENQYGGENRHDKLSPSMSALILISHVKKGVELARASKLGEEVTSIIGQHHGTMLISYFHHRAVEQAEAKGETVREEDFRYPGPRPQSREAGLILLADSIEASSRTLADPSPSRLRGHIDSIVRKVFADGQLDECDLTLKDLHQISEAYHRILTGIFHQRIRYPGSVTGASGGDGQSGEGDGQDKSRGGESRGDNRGDARSESRGENRNEKRGESRGDNRREATVLKLRSGGRRS